MNYLVTLNVGNFMCDNVRQSFTHACERWGVKFLEQKHNYSVHLDMCFSKLFGIRSMFEEHADMRGVLYMDADMLIRDDTPNPFELFADRSKVYAVKDYDDTRWSKDSDSYLNVKNDVATPWIKNVHASLKWNMSEDEIANCTDWFFNAGMFLLYLPESLKEIEAFILNVPDRGHSRYEQALWNYILRVKRKVEFISATWNSINPNISQGVMTSYVYHFTGAPTIVDSVKRKERTFNWKA